MPPLSEGIRNHPGAALAAGLGLLSCGAIAALSTAGCVRIGFDQCLGDGQPPAPTAPMPPELAGHLEVFDAVGRFLSEQDGGGQADAQPGSLPGSGESYLIQHGDTLSEIAAKRGTTVGALQSANGLTSDLIYAGRQLTIPSGSVSQATAPQELGGDTVYAVQFGDTVYSIARSYGLTEHEVMAANGLVYSPMPNNLHYVHIIPGQPLRIPGR